MQVSHSRLRAGVEGMGGGTKQDKSATRGQQEGNREGNKRAGGSEFRNTEVCVIPAPSSPIKAQ